MQDVQSLPDDRGVAIQRAGISEINLPFSIKTKAGSFQTVLAKIKLTVNLPKEYKGTHMSRFVEVLNTWSQKPCSAKEIKAILADIIERMEADAAEIDLGFKYFIEKCAPVSEMKSLIDVDCVFSGALVRGGRLKSIMSVSAPFTSLCPCSKEISSYGAHNQRSLMKVSVRFKPGEFILIEDLVEMMEKHGSAPVYSLLKRVDEKYLTEQAYENPKFVEDVIRDMVLELRQKEEINWFNIECEHYESIHNHNAYAAHSENIPLGGEA